MSYVDLLRKLIQEHLKRSARGLDEIERVAPAAIRAAVSTSTATVPLIRPGNGWIADRIIEQMHEAVDLAREQLEVAEELSQYLGSPDALRAAADSLTRGIVVRAEALAPEVRKDNLRSMLPSAWDGGDASAQYALSFEGQGEAVLRIAEAAKLMAAALESMADGIEEFYLDVAGAVIGLGVSIATAVAGIMTAATGVGALPGIVAAIAGVIGAFGSAATLLSQAATPRGEPVGSALTSLTWPTATFAVS